MKTGRLREFKFGENAFWGFPKILIYSEKLVLNADINSEKLVLKIVCVDILRLWLEQTGLLNLDTFFAILNRLLNLEKNLEILNNLLGLCLTVYLHLKKADPDSF